MVVITLSTLGMLGYRLTPPQHGGLCPVAPIRREWRSLTDDEKTEFTEAVKYWDWSLDWTDLTQSSIWDEDTGFGGDGIIGPGTDNSIALRPIWYNQSYVPHCISRGFRNNQTVGHLRSADFSPEWMGRVKRSPTYVKFIRHVELHLHNTIHKSISGDFEVLTAPNVHLDG
ncbi:hypothetical protein ACCO45_004449 [Purpureocillium lilacinum]|uniref:Uncharacterized protein n=1 Tax=Purpureocillium lilacinum TaxID=33203 RepID=A0ACC4E2Q7_PURLI